MKVIFCHHCNQESEIHYERDADLFDEPIFCPFCGKPASHTPLKTNLKDYIILLPEPVISDNEKAWNEID